MKKLLLFVLILALLGGYALMAMGSSDDSGSFVDDIINDISNFGNDGNKASENNNQGDTTLPNVVGKTAEEAKTVMNNANVKIKEWKYQQSVIQSQKVWENAKSDYGNSFSSAPNKPKLWKVVQQSQVSGGVSLTIELNVINTTNNSDFYKILNEDNVGAKSFVNAHKGELVEFTGVFIAIEQTDPTYAYAFDYLIGGFEDKTDDPAITEFFFFYNEDTPAVRRRIENIKNITIGSVCHFVGEIKDYDESGWILLKPVGIDYIETLII